MIEQDHGFLGAITAQSRVNISPPWSRLNNPRFDPFAIENLFEKLRCLDLIAGRIGGVDLDITAQQRDGFIFESFPGQSRLVRSRADARAEKYDNYRSQ